MKKSDSPSNSSRRSFMKKSVVAAVASGNLTMFSGLANAHMIWDPYYGDDHNNEHMLGLCKVDIDWLESEEDGKLAGKCRLDVDINFTTWRHVCKMECEGPEGEPMPADWMQCGAPHHGSSSDGPREPSDLSERLGCAGTL